MKYVTLVITSIAASILGCATAQANSVYWSDSFESGDFSKWSYVQGTDTSQGGPGPQYVYTTTPTAAAVPARAGNHIAHFQNTPALFKTYPQAKIFKEWTAVGKMDQFRRVEDP